MKDENALRVSSALRSSARYQNNGSENDKRKGAATDADVWRDVRSKKSHVFIARAYILCVLQENCY